MITNGKDPYHSIASFYDRMMDHVPYSEWASYVNQIWKRHGEGSLTSCLDTACGTGRFLLELALPGLELAGMDRSAAMLELAAERISGGDPMRLEPQGNFESAVLVCPWTNRKVLLRRCDLLDFSWEKPVQLVTCLYDSINYLLELPQLVQGLRNLRACLQSHGLLIFDVCTERNSRTHFLNYEDEASLGPWSFHRHSWYHEQKRIQYNEFVVRDTKRKRVNRAHHEQRIYSLREVERAIDEAGLELLGGFAEFGFRRGSERDDRVHYVCRRGD